MFPIAISPKTLVVRKAVRTTGVELEIYQPTLARGHRLPDLQDKAAVPPHRPDKAFAATSRIPQNLVDGCTIAFVGPTTL
jgi:hypothetical protein